MEVTNEKNKLKKRIAKYVKRGFSESQIKEISKGFKHGLSVEQVECYANLKYRPSYMRFIRKGLEKGLKQQYIKSLQFNLLGNQATQYDEEVLYDMTGLDGLDEGDEIEDLED